MINIDFCKKKLIASILCANTIFLTMPVDVYASEISGITPSGNTYNIEAAKVSGSTGFRHYDKFNLTKGDIANLQFKNSSKEYSKFVNLVNNQISINGIVNTMKDNNFYNGHAIFVSPNGMVIGASGLLNVGSLSVLTPTQGKFDSFKNAYDANNLSSYEHNAAKYKELITDSQGNIVVNGKILAREEVNLYGKDIKIGDGTNRAGIIAGWSDEDTSFDDLTAAENTFNSLVSNNITNANSFSLSDGAIQIVANNESGFADAAGDVKANVNIKKADIGANEIDISSTAKVDRQERIDLAEAKVNIENSNITGDTVSITAEATQKKDIDNASIIGDGTLILNTLIDLFGSDTPSIGSLWGVAGKADADITIKNSTLTALKAQGPKLDDGSDNPQKDISVYIHSEASSETAENANFLTPSIINFIKDDEAKISEFFSSGIYNGFEGAKSSATVNIENSTINATAPDAKNVEISTEATSSLDANNRLLAYALPVGMFGVGTETVSKAIVKDSALNVKNGDVDLTAVSSNENSVTIANDSLFSIKIEDAYLGMILNNTVKTETEASLISSTVDAKNFTVLATNLSESDAEVTMEAVAGEKGEQEGEEVHGNSAVSIVGLLNRSDNKVTAKIKDSTVNTKEDTIVLAQSLNVTSNSADASVDDRMVKHPHTFDQKWKDYLKDKQFKYLNVDLFKRIKNGTSIKATQSATLEAGGVLVWNNSNNNATAKIENSKVEAGDVTTQANTVDLLSNAATSDTQGEGKYGIALSVIVNEQNNTTNANIDKSTIEADNVTVDATTELPMNQGKLTFGLNLPFKIAGVEKLQIGGGFASEANGKWDVSFIHPEPEKEEGESDFEVTGLATQNVRQTYEGLKPKVRFEGFFNNLAQTNSVGSNASVSAAVIYNEVNNNTTASIINGSDITINEAEGNEPQGALTVNAVNSVNGYNGLGLFDFLIKKINYKIPGQEDWEYEPTVDGGKFGLGANFAWDKYTNNATAKIDNSTITAEKGTVNVDSASEQSYFSVVMTGGKSEKLGIDGSIHVQNIKGDTNAIISNISGDNEIKAKDISVNAGKAHIKTTAGKVERDEDTNLAKWKEQNPSASGDDKYVREAKDEITNIIAQGAWTSQYEEVDNTVQENSAGVAVGASVNVTNTDRTVKAAIENATVTSTNDLTVNADTYNQKIDVEVAAAFSGGVTQKEAEVEDAQADADAAQDDEDNIFGNLFENEDEYMRNPVGNDLADLQGQFSMSIAGAVDVTTDSTKVEASITNSTVNAGNKVDVKANRESKNINFDGGLGKSKKVGAGAAVNYYNQDGSVKSYIDNSTVEFSGNNSALNLDATNKNWILNIAVGAGAAVNTAAEGKGFQAAIGGSASTNTLKPTIEAYINKSTIGMAEGKTGNINTTLNAKNDVDIINISGGGSYVHGGASGLSAGAAFNYNNIKNTISTYIKDSTLNNIGALTLLADADNNLNDFAVAAAIVTGSDGGFNFNFAGGADVDYIHDTISSKIENSTITASDDVSVKANTNSDNLNVAGTFDLTTAKSGVGVNGDVAVNVYRNTVTAEIDKDSHVLKAKDVKVAATSTEKSNVIPVGISVATDKQFLMAAANVGVNVIDNDVKALVAGNIGTGDNAQAVNSVNVAAYDETTLYSRGGTVAAAAAESIVNVAGSFNIDILDKTVEAKIEDANVKSTGDVTVSATSINSLGGTKDSSGSYSRDDVTTDEYKEKMLHKNSDGEYDGLKQNSSFQNWNMFYDIAAGANVSVAGAAIVKTIQNTVTAEVSKSEIEANNLNVIANDYSIKNIIAGAVDASGKGSVGLQGLVTYDRSTTSALIKNGSTLNIANTIDLDAINRKDNHQIMVAAGGAGKFTVNANIIVNDITDKAISKIDNGSTDNEIKAGTVKVNANEDMNASHIIVTGGGAGNVAVSVSPLINNYDGTVESAIANAQIKDAAIDMDANSSIGTLDIAVGVAGVGQGLSGVGNAIKNDYKTVVKSYIDNSIINTVKTVDIDSNSIIDSNNWIASVAVAGQGVSVPVNVLLNYVDSTVEAGIKNSDIIQSGAITINANKDKEDEISNKAIILGVAGQGVNASVNVIQNEYTNTVTSYVENTSTSAENTKIDSLSVNSYSNRASDNINVGLGVTGEGANLMANVIVNKVNSTTHSYVDAKSKTLNIENALTLDAKDTATSVNRLITAKIVGLGAVAATDINLYYADNLVKSEILSDTSGQINAGSSTLNSEILNALNDVSVNVSAGVAAIPIDVQIVEIGKRTGTYSAVEQDYIDKANGMIPDKLKNTPTTSSGDIKTGAIASINGNLTTKNDININAESKLKGIDTNGNLTDKFKFNKVNVDATAATIAVNIKDMQLASNTIAEIAGGKVESTQGNVALNSKSGADVELTYREVEVAGAQVTGGSAVYNNTAETLSQIKDATVNANNIDVNAKSTNTSLVDATNVIAAVAGVVTVDLAEVKDTNKTSALVTGNTNIDAKGKLTLHSTTSTDLTSDRLSVPVNLINLVGVSRNEATANTITRALIENVNGEINTGNLDIITDYDNMSVFAKSNIVSVSIASLANYNDCGSYMKANFKSGIDSPTALTLTNTGTTNITTAQDNRTGTDAVGIVSKGRIHAVDVSLANFYEGSFSKAENDATSETVLKVKDHTSGNLNINQYLNSTAEAIANNTKVSALGVAAVSADSKDTSTMSLDIAGSNTITGNAVINATHNSTINSDLSNFNLGLLVSGSRLRIDSELTANTTGNIGGDFNVNSANIAFDTTRNSIMSVSSGSGGVINVSDTVVSNNVTGSSTLNVTGLNSDTQKGLNNLSVKNTSTNTMDNTSSDGSGGLISVSENEIHNTFNTSTTTNITNSNMNSDNKIAFEVSNNAIVKDSASMKAGGFVAVADSKADNTYTSGAKLSLDNTTINAKTVDLKASSDVRTKNSGIVDYVGGAGGFVAENEMNLTNTITQTSEIDIKNSILEATNDIVLNALTSSFFKQKTDSSVGGFVAIPRSRNWLTVTNNNKISVDAASKLIASDELEIEFNSNNELEARALSEARHFGFKDPVSESYLTLAVNNTLQNNGSIEAGNLVDINFMQDSTNNLTQYAYSEAHAAIATSTEDGKLTKTVNNVLNVEANSDITSGKDVDISYSIGKGSNSSTIAYKCVSYALFGIPITKTGSKSNASINHNKSLKDDGKIVAAQGNNKYMKINRDGSIDKESLKGFYNDDYSISDGEIIPGDVIKQKILNSLKVEIENTEESINETNQTISDLTATITDFEGERTVVQEKIDEINGLIANGYELKNSVADTQGNSEFNTIIKNDIKTLATTGADSISDSQFNTVYGAYSAVIADIETYNNAHPDSPKSVPSVSEFFANIDSYSVLTPEQKATVNGLSSGQTTNVANAYNTTYGELTETAKGKFTVYKDKYISATNPTGSGCDEMTAFNNEIADIDKRIEPYAEKKESNEKNLNVLIAEKASLQSEYDTVYNTPASKYEERTGSYSVTFNDIISKPAHINVDGAYNNDITGSGIFDVAASGLKIDNYSTRTLLFNKINLDSAINNSGLIIGGKNHGEFAGKEQAVSGIAAYNYIRNNTGSFDNLPKNGVHYKNGGSNIAGITINDYYDTNHPFVSEFDIPNPTSLSHVYILGDVNTSADLNIWNESGDICIVNDSGIKYNNMSLVSTNGNVGFLIYNESDTTPITIKTNDYIFGRDGFSLISNKDVNIQGTIETGYSDRSITITDDMIKPENLIYDPTSGETNMINLGGDKVSFYLNDTNNIKAIYKDNQIYLYNIPKLDLSPSVSIAAGNVTLSGKVKIADGLQNITIDNQTSSQLNIANISNEQFSGYMNAQHLNIIGEGKVTINTVDHANTNITSNGKLALNGVIRNSITTNFDDFPKEKGILNITANNGLDVKQQTKIVDNIPTVVDSIFANGKTTITLNDGQGDINGNITTTGELNIFNKGTGTLNLNGDIKNDASRKPYPETLISEGLINITNENTGVLNINSYIEETEGNINVQSNAQTNISSTILDKKGDISIASKGLNTTEDSKITDDKGNISVTNNASDITLNGDVEASEGNILITNNGDGAIIGGAITDEQGNLFIENNSGNLKVTAEIQHNKTNQNAEGMISIINAQTAGTVDINADIATYGIGKADDCGNVTAILIDNQSSDYGMSLNNAISARIGDIVIKNAADNLSTAGTITNTEQGNINITNNGKEYTNTANITGTKGDINITNTGSGKADVNGVVTANEGNININNSNDGELNIIGDVINQKGKINITNDSNDGMNISGNVTNVQDDTTITNNAGDLVVTETGKVTNTDSGNINAENKGGKFTIAGLLKHFGKGNIDVNNTGDGELEVTETGKVEATEGTVNIANSNDGALKIAGNVINQNGTIDITNDSNDGAEISGNVTNVQDDTTITNNAGDLVVTETGKVTNTDSGNINAENKGGKFTIAGLIKHFGKGNIDVNNTGDGELEVTETGKVEATEGTVNIANSNDGALKIAGNVINQNGTIDITNDSNDGAEISGNVTNVQDDTTITNNAGNLVVTETGKVTNTDSGDIKADNNGGKFTIAGLLKHFGIGNIDVNNTGDGELEVTQTGKVEATEGTVNIANSNDGALKIAGDVVNQNGTINITNDSNDGTEISGNVTNVQDDTTITNNAGDLVVTETGKVTNTDSGNINTENKGDKFTIAGLIKHFGIGNIDVNNTGNGELEVTETGVVAATDGTININNENAGGILVNGSVLSDKGVTNVNNKSDDGIFISTTGKIINQNGDINITNTGKTGIDVQGLIKTEKQNINIDNKDSDLRIGEYDSDNDNYITAVSDNVIINQVNGNILNSITDPDTSKKHQNADIGNPDQAYKTLIATGNNLVINAQDGDIGSSSSAKPGFSVDANTRDYTESINVNVNGAVNANALNKNDTDARLVNIRAKESDLKIENITSDGNIMITAADWKQPDTRPTPKDDESYFKGYSVLNAAQGDNSAVTGQNISVIASDGIGTKKTPFTYTQDTKNAPKSSVSFEAENDIYITGRANSKNPTKINQLISKHGDIEFVLEDDGIIREITAGDHLHILQKAQNLTIDDLGMTQNKDSYDFEDMLNPHDDLKLGGGGTNSVVPQSVAIEVLDSKGGDSANSNLKIYSAAVKGQNNGEGAYDKNGRQIADISLMADNVQANSAKAPDSTVDTKANPEGYKQTDKTYSDAEFDIQPSTTYDALGFNTYGPGTALSFDIKGVDKNYVNEKVSDATRTNYNKVYSINDVTDKFKNDNNQIKDYDYKANNVVLSVDDNVKTNRGVNINSIYADTAYVNTKDSKLEVKDGYITHYGEFRNADKIASVDNDYRRVVGPADIQLYTEKTGSFSLLLKDTINMHTTAPTVYNEPHMLVNGYHSQWNFVNRGFKDNADLLERLDMVKSLEEYDEDSKRISMRFSTTDDEGLSSDVEILDISSTGALIKNDRNLKKGQETTINIKFDDVDVNVKAKVVNVEGDKAGIQFIRMPKAVANKILYRYMRQADSAKPNLTSSLF